MTDIDTATTDSELPEDLDLATLLDSLAAVARESSEPVRLAAGTFAIYPMPDGGMMIVMQVDEGPLAGPEAKHARVPASLIRGLTALAGGGGKMGALKAIVSRKRA